DPAALKLDLGVRHNLCGGIGGIGGKIIAKAQGGTPNSNGYTLELRKNGTVVSRTTTQSGVYTFTVDAGAYEVKAIDGNNCNKTATATVIDLPVPSVTVTYTLYDCGARGKITFSEPQSTVTYTYQYSLTRFQPSFQAPIIQSGREFPGLTAGDYFTAHVHYTYAGETCTITIRDIQVPNITADNNLIASAGVSKLIGCFDGTDADKGEIRFSNVQGGVPPYEFSFDGGATWTSTRVMRKSAGSYNLAVRDAIECARTGLQVTIPAKVTQPTFTPTITYNCEGKGTYVQNSSKGSAYTYTYQLNGGTPQNSNTFSNLAPGTYTITIHYADANPPSKNVLFLEDFGVGTEAAKTPYINKVYYFEPQNGSSILYNGNGQSRPNSWGDNINDGEYVVRDIMRPNPWGDNPVDHTRRPNGRILFINVGNSVGIAGILYQRKMTDIIPNKPIKFSIALFNLHRGDGHSVNPVYPKIGLELYRTEADALAGTNRLAVNDLGYIPGHANVNDWKEHNIEMNPGNNTELVAVVRSYSNVIGGNDLAMDDIYLYQEPEACTFSYTTTFKIESGKEFG
ncbi:hypothetical protein HMPREF9075_02446, partial [Capnocytophaga sp. oral taxon 332 str. F0381]